jgi:hypothetical protein
LSSFSYRILNEVDISGINVKLGFLFTPVKFIRFSGAIHTPNFLSLTDKYQATIDSHWLTPDADGNTDYSVASDLNLYDYHLTTPWRAIGGVGLVIGKYLALNGEYEFADYSNIRMSAPDYGFLDENQAIVNNYTVTQNIRAGAELRLSAFYFRGGYAIYSSPFKNATIDKSTKYFTGGFGVRTDDFFFDLAYKQRLFSTDYYLYNGYTDEPYAILDNKTSNFFVTFGLIF